MKQVLITGITGFVGSHLADLLLEKGYKVYGTYRWRSPLDNISHIKDKLNLIQADLSDARSMDVAVKQANPDYIFHLAAQSYVLASWVMPAQTIQTNVVGQVNLLEAVRKADINPVIHIAASSEIYGLVHPSETPIKETNPVRPLSTYGVSKLAQDMLGYQYFKSYGMKIIRTRAFNHTGPRRGDVFVTSNWTKQVAEIENLKKEPVMYVGNLHSKRDFTDVRDMVKAYLLAVEKGTPGEVYNIGSGKAIQMSELLKMILSLSKEKIRVEQDPARMRPSDVDVLVCDCTKFHEATGWTPKIKFEQTLKDLLDYWRSRTFEQILKDHLNSWRSRTRA
jgi:GDP-4-dehydro-6-deoxy-D-mannose reductase